MDFLTAAVMIVAIIAATVVVAIKTLASTPARIVAVIGAIAVLLAGFPRLFQELSPAAAPSVPSSTVTVMPEQPGQPLPAAPASPTAPDSSATGGAA